ncbi:transporter substrate-binding domain-containing protein [Maridesulfovibrio sp.]|uniref:transporter substrate-binding domain-containing protein n=1 Tax=Maridesulfovibrio sp. TaxID=2795000 RepID=UPI002AA6E9B2|nr:transporter substrate-binding domain-containing protein [Maridesulfovibrio sp.]
MSLIILIVCSATLGALGCMAAAARSFELNADEIRYIKEHPVVTLGVDESFDPFVHRNEDGSYSGIDVDITDLIFQKTGLKFKFELGKWTELLKRAEKREIDGMASTISHPSRARYFNFSVPYCQYSSVVLVKKNNPEKIHCLKDLEGKRATVMTGNINMLNQVKRLGVDVKIIWESDTYELVKSVASGRSDFIIAGEPAFYIVAKLGMADFIESSFPTGETTSLCYSLRNDQPELVSIFNKVLRSIPQEQIVGIRARWLQGGAWNPVDLKGRIKISDRERDFLSIRNNLGVGLKEGLPPFCFFAPNGRLKGMVADFMQLADDSLGSGIKMLPVESADPVRDLLENKCDLVMMCELKEPPEPGVTYTTPYVSFPYVVVARMDKLFQDEFQPEAGQMFLSVKGSGILTEMEKAYPGIKVREVESVKSGLKQVRDGFYAGLIATSPIAAHEVQTNFLTELKIIGHTRIKASYAVATRTSSVELNHIFQKIVGSMSSAEVRGVVNKWMAVKYERGVDYALIWKIVLGAVVLLAGILYWNRVLRQAKLRAEEALEAERAAIKANLNFIDMISHEYRSPLAVISSNLDLLEFKTSREDKKDVSKELGRMRNSTRKLVHIFEKSLAKIRLDNAGMQPEKQQVDIVHLVSSAVRDIRNAHPDHTVNFQQTGDIPVVVGDPDLLNIAVINILDNACKYSEADSAVTVNISAQSRRIVVEVSDYGMGIRAEDLERIFEKYFRSQNVGRKLGVGIGLYLVKKIIALHEGEIRVTSRFGEGAVFVMELPVFEMK